MENQVGWEKDNPLTRMANQVKQMNIDRGNAAGGFSGTPVQQMTPTMVRTAPMLVPRQLSPEETAELDEKARNLGILEEDDTVGPPINPIGDLPEKYRPPTPMKHVPQVPAQFTKPEYVEPRLPNFRNVDGFDLRNGLVLVDGMKFPLPAEAVADFKRYAMEIALDHVTKELASALAELGGTNLGVAPMPEGNGKPTTEEISETEGEHRDT